MAPLFILCTAAAAATTNTTSPKLIYMYFVLSRSLNFNSVNQSTTAITTTMVNANSARFFV